MYTRVNKLGQNGHDKSLLSAVAIASHEGHCMVKPGESRALASDVLSTFVVNCEHGVP
jgi:hypothetical protein